MAQAILRNRIVSIDILRGIVMVIMALDHVRDFFHISANTADPLDLATTTPLLFFTRWITHYCAPIFVFLSGISIYLQGQRKERVQLSQFLISRGAWLIFVEWFIISFGWTFNLQYVILPFQVIWAIGISMLLLGCMLYLRFSYVLIFFIGAVIVLGHNVLDSFEATDGFQSNFLWDLLHYGVFKPYPIFGNHNAMIVYPFLPWLGLMLLGYSAGVFFTNQLEEGQRRRIFLRIGTFTILFFILLRFTNAYGDNQLWSSQKNLLYTILSFIDTDKYPPSLLYLCMTIGPAFIALAFLEKFKGRIADIFSIYGRTAFFYYILHIYMIHFFAMVLFFAKGHTMSDAMNLGAQHPFLFVLPGEGFGLAGVYLVWIAVVLLLYPLCRWYDHYKRTHKSNRWLSYL